MALTRMFGFDHLPDGLVVPKLIDAAQTPYLELLRTMFTFSNMDVTTTISTVNVDGIPFKGLKIPATQGASINTTPAGLNIGFRLSAEAFTGFSVFHIKEYYTGNVWDYTGATSGLTELGITAGKGSYYIEMYIGSVNGKGYSPFTIAVNGVQKVSAYCSKSSGLNWPNSGVVLSDLYYCVGGASPGITFPLGSVRVKTSKPSHVVNSSNLLTVNTSDPADVELGKVWVGKTSKDGYCLIDKPGVESTIEFPQLSENIIAAMVEVQTSRGSASASTITLTPTDGTTEKTPLTYTPSSHAALKPDIKNFMFDKPYLAAETGGFKVKVKC